MSEPSEPGGPRPRRDSLSALVFRVLLLLFPSSFRETYGAEMLELFRERVARARSRGGWATIRLWARTFADVTVSAGAERLGSHTRLAREGTNAESRLRGIGWHEDNGTEREGGMGGWMEDIRHSARRLARSPLFTAAAVAILAVGIGANTAAFSIVDAALFRPPPFARPEEIVTIYQDSDDGEPSSAAFPAYRDIAATSGVFAGVAATSPDNAVWEKSDESRQVSIEYTTSSYFPLLGLVPSRGTWFSSEHDQPGAGTFAVVSHRTWSAEMGAAPGAIGSTIRLNGQPVTLLGVGPEDFNGPGGALAIDFWLSISSTIVGGEYRVQNLDFREDHWYDVTARMAPGVSLAQARAAMDALALRMGEQNPELDEGRGLTVFAMGDVRFDPEVDGMLYSVGVGVLAVVGLVLLLACSNLANLLLVRGVSRAPEMAVRLALGAGRLRVARLFLLEAFLLSTLGAGAGILLARWAVGLFAYLPLGPGGFGPRPTGMILDVGIDGRVLTFTTTLAVATGLFFGLVPALRAAGVQVAGTLREDLRSSAGPKSSLLRNVLVGVQVAVSLVLLVGAGLLTRSLSNVRGVDPGVDADQVAVLGVNPAQGGVSDDEAPILMQQLRERAAALPGVTHVALATRLPVQPGGSTTTVVEGYDPPAGTGAVEMPFAYVSPAFFETLGVGLATGRTFGPDDRPETPRVVIVNETAAQRFWAGDAVGKRVRPQGSATAWREVIGVVEDVKVSDLREPATPMMYYSMEQVQVGCCYVLARVDGDAAALAPSLRRMLQEVRPELTPTQLGTLETHVGEALAVPRAAATLMGVFSLLALVLATLGIYAVVSFAVARRSAELGIRIALGAARARVIRMVVGESLVTVGFGVLAGLGLALVAAPNLEGILFQVEAADPSAFVGGAALLLLVALAASWVPAWRAARADPAGVLRAQ